MKTGKPAFEKKLREDDVDYTKLWYEKQIQKLNW